MNYPTRELNKLKKKSVQNITNKIKKGEFIYVKTKCFICNFKKVKKMFANDRYGIPINLGMCKKCGLVYENPVFDDNSLKGFYSSNEYRNIYGGLEEDTLNKRFKYDDTYVFDTNNYSANESFFKFIENSKVKFNNVLEVGSGGGWNSTPFIKKGFKYTGIEPTKALVKEGKKRGVNLIQGFLKDVNQNYDLIIMRHVLEHLKTPVEDLKYLSRYTSNIAIEIPGFIYKIPSLQNAHTFYFSLNTLKKTCSLAGFEIKYIETFTNNGFIMALFSKKDNSKFKYSYFKEKIKIQYIYFNFVFRLRLKRFISNIK